MTGIRPDKDDETTLAYALGRHFAHLTGEGGCIAVTVDDRFWSTGISSLPPGRLASLIESDRDWSNWERHPEGDELIIQLDGQLLLILDREGDLATVLLGPGDFAIVPKGVWHTADVPRPGRALYVTPGAGTESRVRAGEA